MESAYLNTTSEEWKTYIWATGREGVKDHRKNNELDSEPLRLKSPDHNSTVSE